jgi:hypothetical protein
LPAEDVIVKSRPITDIDRMLAAGDRIDRAIGKPPTKDRRRTHLRFGKLVLVVVEQTGEPTIIVEATTSELAEAANAVQKILENPPPTKPRKSQ